MNKEINCAIVKDLLPVYIDKLTSNETNQIVESHLSVCDNCAKEYGEMMGTLKMDKVPEEPNLDVFLKKTKNMYLLKGLALSVGVIGVLVSFIVDIAVNRKLTWSLIVDVSLLYIYITAFAAMYSKKNKVLIATLTGSVLVLPVLYSIEFIVNKNYFSYPVSWFKIYALPITLIWLSVIWVTILFGKLAKVNLWYTLALLLLLTTIGSALTNAIARQVSVSVMFHTSTEWINSLCYLGSAIICFIMGIFRRGKSAF